MSTAEPIPDGYASSPNHLAEAGTAQSSLPPAEIRPTPGGCVSSCESLVEQSLRPILDKLGHWDTDPENFKPRQERDDEDLRKPVIFVSGDASLAHMVLQRDDANIFDRFLKGRELEDFYVPGGTFMLEFLLEACREQQVDAGAKLYSVRGPYRRRWTWPHYAHGVVDIRTFPRDTTTIEEFPLTKNANAQTNHAYRVCEGLGFRKEHYLQSIQKVEKVLQHFLNHPDSVVAQVWPGSDDNFRLYLAKNPQASLKGPFIFVLNLEFAYFGGNRTRDKDGKDSDSDRIARLAHIQALEKHDPQCLFVLKIKHRSAWNGMRDSTERDIRTSLVEFLLKERRADRTVMLISSNELRQANVYISNHLSWERTIQSTLFELKIVERQMNTVLAQGDTCTENTKWDAVKDAASQIAYGFLILPKHLVISFGGDGAMYLTLQLTPTFDVVTKRVSITLTIESCHFVVDPTEAEGTYSDKYSGRMRGYDSLLTASLAHRLMEARRKVSGAIQDLDYQQAIIMALVFGLKAGRLLQVHGYDLYVKEEWAELRDAVSSETLDPYRFSTRFVEWVNTLSQWALGPGESLHHLPVMPFDSLTSIIVHRSIKRFPDQPLFTTQPQPNDMVMQRFHDIQRRQEREWRSLGFFQVLTLPKTYYNTFLQDGEPEEFVEDYENVLSLGYGSFDRTWWRIVDAAIPDNLAHCFDFPISPHQARQQAARFNNSHAPGNWQLHRVKSLMIAYASLLHGLDIFHPTNADEARGHLCRILATAVDICASLNAFTQGLPRTRCVAKIMNHLLPIVSQDLDTKADEALIRQSYCASWKRRNLPKPKNINEICEFVTHDTKLSLTWKGRIEHVLGFLEVLRDAHKAKYGVSPLRLWLGLFPKVQIGTIASIERREVESFRMLERILREYVARKEEKKPLNIGVFGPAGAGKSFAVMEIAKAIVPEPTGMMFLTFNLSQFTGPATLVDAFEEISDAGLQGKLPVVFWDEYDSPLGTQKLG